MQWLDEARQVITLSSPFFAYLMYSIPVVENDSLGTAYTDGSRVFMPSWSLEKWGQAGTTAVYLHEIIHCALGHVQRAKEDKKKWNVAADYFVNNVISEVSSSRLRLPESALVCPSYYTKLSVDEIYEILESTPEDAEQDLVASGDTRDISEVEAELEAAKSTFYSLLSGSLKREVEETLRAKIDWREELSRYLVRFSDDYTPFEFDRRFEDFFFPEITGEKITGVLALDTSGSVGPVELSCFLAESLGVFSAFDNIELTVLLFHTEVYYSSSIYDTSDIDNLLQHLENGGTSFIAPIKQVENIDASFLIIFTDLYGPFPSPPEKDVIWISTTDQIAPFGTTLRMEVC